MDVFSQASARFVALRKANEQLEAVRLAVAELGSVTGVEVTSRDRCATTRDVLVDLQRVIATLKEDAQA